MRKEEIFIALSNIWAEQARYSDGTKVPTAITLPREEPRSCATRYQTSAETTSTCQDSATWVLQNFICKHGPQFTVRTAWGTTGHTITECATRTTLYKEGQITLNYTLLAHPFASFKVNVLLHYFHFKIRRSFVLCPCFTSSGTLNSIWNTDVNCPIVWIFLLHRRQQNTPTFFDPKPALTSLTVAMTANILRIESKISGTKSMNFFRANPLAEVWSGEPCRNSLLSLVESKTHADGCTG